MGSTCLWVMGHLLPYLERTLPPSLHKKINVHLDHCSACRDGWNHFRWDRAKNTGGYAEFQAYLRELGEPLQDYLDSSQALLSSWQQNPPQTLAERDAFFRSTPYYLYNLVIWHESGNRPPYLAAALPVLHQLQAHTICDFGCGIGSDGLDFLDQGFQVIFCEFENASSRFARWRLRQRQCEAIWIEPTEIQRMPSVDTLWAIDVIDHLLDLRVLCPLLEICRIVCVENDAHQKAHGAMTSSFHLYHPPTELASLLADYHFRPFMSSPLLKIWHKE